ncbi:hypothetical protein [Komagataeibacter swingsii]|uniref:hypothetical protein n=1 Tax=Komagataeibacter swingsii TaxID=215220 RepID=UPI0011B61F26|nr:hypothetical protein [Komagataeibacter swingsii]
MKRIVYEDDELKCFFRSDSSRFLLITFNDMIFDSRGDRFFADTVAINANISALGIVSKKANWFPKNSMDLCYESAEKIISAFDKIVIYGASMGGYAAIKYSKLFGADTVISLCPQWSIDAEECNLVDDYWKCHFRSDMKNMGIQSDDMQGSIFIFVDNLHKTDMFHALRIKKESGNVQIVNVPLVGHDITPVMSGTESMKKIIECCINRDIGALKNISRERRRKSFYYKEAIIKRKYRNKKIKNLVVFLFKKTRNINHRYRQFLKKIRI